MNYPAIGLIVCSNILYHVCQKSTPSGVNPAISLVVAYGVALLSSLVLLFFFPLKESLPAAAMKVNWASILLGLAVTGVELGFLIAYRYGSNISNTQFSATTILTVALIPIGILFYREKLSLVNIAGIAVCVAGFMMMHYRK